MAFDKTKIDSELGKRIQKHLVNLGIHTPMAGKRIPDLEQIDIIESRFRDIMEVLGLNLLDDSLNETPIRIATMLVTETTWGLRPENFPKCTTVENKMNYDEMVVVKNVRIQSVCEHHWQNIDGKATIAYIPKNKVLGLSKFSRIAEYFSRRPQIQERLTAQIFHSLSYILETNDVAVLIEATHSCMSCRGVEDPNSQTITSKLGGLFKTDASTRVEFMNIAGNKE